MKNLYLLLLFTGIVNAQVISIPDANFKATLLAANVNNNIAQDIAGNNIVVDKNGNKEIEQAEASAVYVLNIDGFNIASLEGIRSFTNLQLLTCVSNNLTTLNLTGLAKLQDVNCSKNDITALTVTGLTSLIGLACQENQINTLDLAGLSNLNTLYCQSNQLTGLDVSGLTSLNVLDCSANQIQSLNFAGLTNLADLNCSQNQLQTLNTTGLVNLNNLNCSDNQITTLTLSGLDNLYLLNCGSPVLTSLNLSALNNLLVLVVSRGAITSLDLQNVPSLATLIIERTDLTVLDLSVLPNLSTLNCHNNSILTRILLKNGKQEQNYGILSNPNLTFVCADEAEVSTLQTYFTTTGQTGVTVNSNCSLGTQDILAAASVKIYPNPTTGIIHITAANNLKLAQIYDLQGRLLQTNTVNASTTTIDISARAAGIYFLKLETANGLRMEKIIKQ